MAVPRVLCSNQLRAKGHIQAKLPMKAAEVLLQGAVQKPKRQQIDRACTICKRTKAKCSDERPCARCVRTNQAALCVDSDSLQARQIERRFEFKSGVAVFDPSRLGDQDRLDQLDKCDKQRPCSRSGQASFGADTGDDLASKTWQSSMLASETWQSSMLVRGSDAPWPGLTAVGHFDGAGALGALPPDTKQPPAPDASAILLQIRLPQWEIVDMGPGAVRFFKDSPFGDMRGQSLDCFVHPEDFAALEELSQRVLHHDVDDTLRGAGPAAAGVAKCAFRLMHFSRVALAEANPHVGALVSDSSTTSTQGRSSSPISSGDADGQLDAGELGSVVLDAGFEGTRAGERTATSMDGVEKNCMEEVEEDDGKLTVVSYVRITLEVRKHTSLVPGSAGPVHLVVASDSFEMAVDASLNRLHRMGGLSNFGALTSRVNGIYQMNAQHPDYGHPADIRAMRRGKSLLSTSAGSDVSPGVEEASATTRFLAQLQNLKATSQRVITSLIYSSIRMNLTLGFISPSGVPTSQQHIRFDTFMGHSKWYSHGCVPVDATPIRALNLQHLGDVYGPRILSLEEDRIVVYELICMPKTRDWKMPPPKSRAPLAGLECMAPPCKFVVDIDPEPPHRSRMLYSVTAILPRGLSTPSLRRERASCRLDRVDSSSISFDPTAPLDDEYGHW